MLILPKRARKRKQPVPSTLETSQGKRGRPMKSPDELTVPRRDRKARAQQVHQQSTHASQMAPPTDLSTFERLPIEIIQHIFFYALEVNLANASRSLNLALSKESIYRALILFAYFDDDGSSPVESKQFRPAEFRRLDSEDRVRLQYGILKCRWCSLDRIKGCMPALSRLTMVQAWHREQVYEEKTFTNILGDATFAPREIIRVPDEQLLDIAPLPDIIDGASMQAHFSARLQCPYYGIFQFAPTAIGPTNEDGFLPFIQYWDYSPLVENNSDGLVHKLVGHATATLGAMVIPDKLLEGEPWTDDKVYFLQLLRQGLRYKQHSEYIVVRRAAMLQGMESAIRDGSVKILRILVELHERIGALYQDGPNLDQENDSGRGSNVSLNSLPPYLFHRAARAGTSSSDLLSLLIRVSWRSIDPDDTILTGWALRAEAAGDRLGRWLKKYMEGYGGQDFHGRPVFMNGAVSWRLRAENFPFPETSFTDEARYLHDHAPDLPMKRWAGP
jgi:hypothetical protein